MDIVQKFVDARSCGHFTFDDFIYLVPGGSFVSGTNDETSDLDYRAVVLLNDDYYFGLKQFEHQKIISGEGGINTSNLDLDVEVFEVFSFLRQAINGEIIPFEMLFINPALALISNRIFSPILVNRDLFLSKQVAAKYYGFIQKCIHRMSLPESHFKKEISKFRVREFNYESKEAMNAIKTLRISNELLRGEAPSLMRSDREELMKIKRGEVEKDVILSMIDDLLGENRRLYKESKLVPEKVDFEKAHLFVKGFKKDLYEQMLLSH
jgi:predicted nucleotidyltransferase